MQNTKVALAILTALAVVSLIQLLYYYVIYGKFTFHRKNPAISLRDIPLSVVIVVRDNASQILQSLPNLLSQQYPNYEIVVVNDRSPDEQTLLTLKEYQKRYSNIKFIDLSEAVSTSKGKKMAISFGIKCSSYDNIVITTPDCEPASVHWLSSIAKNFQNNKKIVLGYSTYTKRKNPYNLFLHYDNLISAIQYFSHAMRKTTYKGDFSNVAFIRPLFYKQKGFSSFNQLEWGEEDIFIHRISTPNNTSVEYSPESIVIKHNIPQYGYWRSHKISMFYTRKLNSPRNRFSLSLFNITNLLFYIFLTLSILASISIPTLLYTSIGIGIIRIVSFYVTIGISASKLGEKNIVPFALLYDILFSILNPLYFISSRINTKKHA